MPEPEQLFPGAPRIPREPVASWDTSIQYAGFSKRLGAHLLDILILLPLSLLEIWAGDLSRWLTVYFVPFGVLFGIWYSVYLVKRYGGTPGKRLMKISIKRVDLGAVTYREAWLRYIVMFILGIASSIAFVIALLKMGDAEYFSMSYLPRAVRLNEMTPPWNQVVVALTNLWIWGEFLVMLTNDKRRALHDFMAGTVVVCDDPMPPLAAA